MTAFQADYLLLTFLASLGAIQVGASLGLYKRLLIFRDSKLSLFLGLAMVIGAFSWFFASDHRNVNDTEGGLNATAQIAFLALDASTALLTTLLLTSVANLYNAARGLANRSMDALKASTFYDTIARRIQRGYRTRLRYYGRNYK